MIAMPSCLPRAVSLQGIVVLLATGFGAGRWFPAPGTAGAAIGSLLAWGISYLSSPLWQIVALVGLVLIGIPLCTEAGRALGGKKDNQAIVWDEIVTVPIVFLIVPLDSWAIGLLGFALHRLFDITKPPPARQVERLPDGLGVMADDCVAAFYACVALYGIVGLLRWAGMPLDG